ncbi:hypothetical protein AYB34_17275 [Leptospira sp. ZV016]|nr:hypothetical protein LEP1GSC198_2056 [Leptospira kirschneri str. JB]KXZ28889.1 hypothetical protein AYB34_17275 [Leptospira sp. ZV016]KXZ29372.1 hypothetical protein AYB32_09850 [Leptospira kirschneri]
MVVPTDLVTLQIFKHLAFVRVPTFLKQEHKTYNVFFDFTVSAIKTQKNSKQKTNRGFLENVGTTTDRGFTSWTLKIVGTT